MVLLSICGNYQMGHSSNAPMTDQPPTRVYKTHFKTQQDQDLIRLALIRSPFFSGIDAEQLERLVETAHLQTYQPGEIVILEGCIDETDSNDNNDKGSNKKETKSSVMGENLVVDGPADSDEYDDENETRTMSEENKSQPYLVPSLGEDEQEMETKKLRAGVDKSTPGINDYSNQNAQSLGGYENPENTNDNITSLHDNEKTLSAPIRKVPPTTPLSTLLINENDTLEKGMSKNDSLPYFSVSSTSPTPNAEKEHSSQANPPPPRSGNTSNLYIVRNGRATVWYQPNLNPVSLGSGSIFGEGGFLFGRQHSSSVLADGDNNHDNHSGMLECWVIDHETFCNHVLPSPYLKELFQANAKQSDENGCGFMSMEDLVMAVTTLQTQDEGLPIVLQDSWLSGRVANTYNILQQRRKKGNCSTMLSLDVEDPRIYLDDFCFFYFLMSRADPEIDVAFMLIDENQTGRISFQDLARFLQHVYPDIDLQTNFFQRYFGINSNRLIRPVHFAQFLTDLQREMGEQAYLQALEKHGTSQGYLYCTSFVHVLQTACGWRLPVGVVARLESMYMFHDHQRKIMETNNPNIERIHIRPGTESSTEIRPASSSLVDEQHHTVIQSPRNKTYYFAYADFLAFQEVLGNIPFLCTLIDKAQQIKNGPISPNDFMVANRVQGLGNRLSRRQVEIVFDIFDLNQDGYISFEDTVTVCGIDYARRLVSVKGREGKLTFASNSKSESHESVVDRTPIKKVLTGLFHLGVAATVGGIGVALLYPFDLVTVRMMNQRIGLDGLRMYQNYFDCFLHAIRAERVAGLYRGLTPALLVVAPERAIKLQVHSLLLRAYTFGVDDETAKSATNETSKPTLWLEALAGGCAGASQLLVTNPMELTKIRLQLQGETAQMLVARGIQPPSNPPNFIGVVRDLGFPGIYRGASACLLRDIPFSAIYFPAYAAVKEAIVDFKTGSTISPRRTTPLDILFAGTIAGMPAAFLTTPADVIKTRLQVLPRPGESSYLGIVHCATKIYQEEGIAAFFQGSMMRVLRIAPQFGVSLLVYEGLATMFGFERSSRPPTTLPVDPVDYRSAFALKNSSTPGMFGTFLYQILSPH